MFSKLLEDINRVDESSGEDNVGLTPHHWHHLAMIAHDIPGSVNGRFITQRDSQARQHLEKMGYIEAHRNEVTTMSKWRLTKLGGNVLIEKMKKQHGID